MTKDRGLRRWRPHLERLEPRDLPSTFQVVGPDPNDPGAKGPFLNLIVVKDSSPDGPAAPPRARRTRGHAAPAHRPGPHDPGKMILAPVVPFAASGAQGQDGENLPSRPHP